MCSDSDFSSSDEFLQEKFDALDNCLSEFFKHKQDLVHERESSHLAELEKVIFGKRNHLSCSKFKHGKKSRTKFNRSEFRTNLEQVGNMKQHSFLVSGQDRSEVDSNLYKNMFGEEWTSNSENSWLKSGAEFTNTRSHLDNIQGLTHQNLSKKTQSQYLGMRQDSNVLQRLMANINKLKMSPTSIHEDEGSEAEEELLEEQEQIYSSAEYETSPVPIDETENYTEAAGDTVYTKTNPDELPTNLENREIEPRDSLENIMSMLEEIHSEQDQYGARGVVKGADSEVIGDTGHPENKLAKPRLRPSAEVEVFRFGHEHIDALSSLNENKEPGKKTKHRTVKFKQEEKNSGSITESLKQKEIAPKIPTSEKPPRGGQGSRADSLTEDQEYRRQRKRQEMKEKRRKKKAEEQESRRQHLTTMASTLKKKSIENLQHMTTMKQRVAAKRRKSADEHPKQFNWRRALRPDEADTKIVSDQYQLMYQTRQEDPSVHKLLDSTIKSPRNITGGSIYLQEELLPIREEAEVAPTPKADFQNVPPRVLDKYMRAQMEELQIYINKHVSKRTGSVRIIDIPHPVIEPGVEDDTLFNKVEDTENFKALLKNITNVDSGRIQQSSEQDSTQPISTQGTPKKSILKGSEVFSSKPVPLPRLSGGGEGHRQAAAVDYEATPKAKTAGGNSKPKRPAIPKIKPSEGLRDFFDDEILIGRHTLQNNLLAFGVPPVVSGRRVQQSYPFPVDGSRPMGPLIDPHPLLKPKYHNLLMEAMREKGIRTPKAKRSLAKVLPSESSLIREAGARREEEMRRVHEKKLEKEREKIEVRKTPSKESRKREPFEEESKPPRKWKKQIFPPPSEDVSAGPCVTTHVCVEKEISTFKICPTRGKPRRLLKTSNVEIQLDACQKPSDDHSVSSTWSTMSHQSVPKAVPRCPMVYVSARRRPFRNNCGADTEKADDGTSRGSSSIPTSLIKELLVAKLEKEDWIFRQKAGNALMQSQKKSKKSSMKNRETPITKHVVSGEYQSDFRKTSPIQNSPRYVNGMKVDDSLLEDICIRTRAIRHRYLSEEKRGTSPPHKCHQVKEISRKFTAQRSPSGTLPWKETTHRKQPRNKNLSEQQMKRSKGVEFCKTVQIYSTSNEEIIEMEPLDFHGFQSSWSKKKSEQKCRMSSSRHVRDIDSCSRLIVKVKKPVSNHEVPEKNRRKKQADHDHKHSLSLSTFSPLDLKILNVTENGPEGCIKKSGVDKSRKVHKPTAASVQWMIGKDGREAKGSEVVLQVPSLKTSRRPAEGADKGSDRRVHEDYHRWTLSLSERLKSGCPPPVGSKELLLAFSAVYLSRKNKMKHIKREVRKKYASKNGKKSHR